MKFLFSIALILVYFSACNSPQKEQSLEIKFKKIQKGMNKSDVVAILGSPANIQVDTSDNSETMYYEQSTYNLSSEVPTIILDSNKKVRLIIPKDDD